MTGDVSIEPTLTPSLTLRSSPLVLVQPVHDRTVVVESKASTAANRLMRFGLCGSPRDDWERVFGYWYILYQVYRVPVRCRGMVYIPPVIIIIHL